MQVPKFLEKQPMVFFLKYPLYTSWMREDEEKREKKKKSEVSRDNKVHLLKFHSVATGPAKNPPGKA